MPSLDPFYTNSEIAAKYAAHMMRRWNETDVLFIEPSAGNGAFVEPLVQAEKKVFAIDIKPMNRLIIKGDYLKTSSIGNDDKVKVVIGNPPFGKNASLAVQFFNHAAIDASEIGFIVPRTFRKISVQNRLNPYFHLTYDKSVPDNSFVLDDEPYDVPCAWQIWTRRKTKRRRPTPPAVDHLIGYTTPFDADFAMRRVGFYAGRVILKNLNSLSQTTHYFMREMADGVIDTLSCIDWTDLTAQTAGPRSLSKTEIAIKLGEAYHA